jgi:tetratricopeptide (TPR) repeat protein
MQVKRDMSSYDPPPLDEVESGQMTVFMENVGMLQASGTAKMFRQWSIVVAIDKRSEDPLLIAGDPRIFKFDLPYIVKVASLHRIPAAILWEIHRRRKTVPGWLGSPRRERASVAFRALLDLAISDGGWDFDRYPLQSIEWLQEKLELSRPQLIALFRKTERAYQRIQRRDALWSPFVAAGSLLVGLIGGHFFWGLLSLPALFFYAAAVTIGSFAPIAAARARRSREERSGDLEKRLEQGRMSTRAPEAGEAPPLYGDIVSAAWDALYDYRRRETRWSAALAAGCGLLGIIGGLFSWGLAGWPSLLLYVAGGALGGFALHSANRAARTHGYAYESVEEGEGNDWDGVEMAVPGGRARVDLHRDPGGMAYNKAFEETLGALTSGDEAMKRGDVERARDRFAMAAGLGERSSLKGADKIAFAARIGLARVLKGQGKRDRALAMLNKIDGDARKSPDFERLSKDLADSGLKDKEDGPPMGKEPGRKQASRRSEDVHSLIDRSIARARQRLGTGDPKAALQILEDLAGRDPRGVYMALPDYYEILIACKKNLGLDCRNEESMVAELGMDWMKAHELARRLLGAKRYKESLIHFQRSISANPCEAGTTSGLYEAYRGMAAALKALGRHEEAEAYVKKIPVPR